MTRGPLPTTNWPENSLLREAERRERERARERAQLLEAELARRLALKARDRLAYFLRAAWHVIEPSTPLAWGWHLDAICEHLEAVTAGRIKNLLITIPPGCTKSILVAVMWPAWVWATDPSVRWLFASNESDLATRDSLACRYVLTSDWYRTHFPGVQLVGDQNVKTWYQTSARGHRQAVTVAAKVTGKKGDVLVTDDPNDAQKVESEADRKAVASWWKDAFFDRVNDFKTGRRVVIGQRTHKSDLIGFIKESGGFEELMVPEEFEVKRRCRTSIGWCDPREKEGELLRPDRFGPDQVLEAKKRLGTIGYRAKHQQDPQDKEGYRFKAKWFADRLWRYDGDFIVLDDGKGSVQRFRPDQRPRWGTADGAASAKTSADFTAVSAWVTSPRNDLVWVGCRREQLEIPDQPDMLAEEYRKHRMQWCGVEAVLANVALYQHARRTNMVIRKLDPERQDKLARATPAIVFAESGRVWLPDHRTAREIGFPLDAVLAELTAFTGEDKRDEHDDIVDNLSYAVKCHQAGGTPSGAGTPAGVHKPSGRV